MKKKKKNWLEKSRSRVRWMARKLYRATKRALRRAAAWLLANLKNSLKAPGTVDTLVIFGLVVAVTFALRLVPHAETRAASYLTLAVVAGMPALIQCIRLAALASRTLRLRITKPGSNTEVDAKLLAMMPGLGISIATVLVALHFSPMNYGAMWSLLRDRARNALANELALKPVQGIISYPSGASSNPPAATTSAGVTPSPRVSPTLELQQQIADLKARVPLEGGDYAIEGVNKHPGDAWFRQAADLYVKVARRATTAHQQLLRSGTRQGQLLTHEDQRELCLPTYLDGYVGHTPYDRLAKAMATNQAMHQVPTSGTRYIALAVAGRNLPSDWPEAVLAHLTRCVAKVESLEQALIASR